MRRPSRTTAWSSTISTRIIRPGTSRRTVVPAPGAERISQRPPSSRARSSIDVSPRCRERSSGLEGSKPIPSSVTATVSSPLVAAGERDVTCSGRRGGARCGSPRGRSAGPPGALGVAVDVDRRRRARSATPWTRSSIAISLRSAPASPSRSSSGGRSPRISERSSSSASRASVCSRATCARRRLAGRGRAASRRLRPTGSG